MDKEENVQTEVNPIDLPAINTDANQSTQTSTEIDLPTINVQPKDSSLTLPEFTQANNQLDMTLPSLSIENSESVDDNIKPIQGNSVLDSQADFQSIFSVESEEKKETTVAEKKSLDKSLSPVIEIKKEESALPADKVLTPEAENEKNKQRQKNFNGSERIIYEIKEEKEGNPIVVVLFFLALISVIIILPFISKKVEFNNGILPKKEETTEKTNADELYIFGRSSVRAKIGNLEFTNFVKHQNIDGTYSLTFNLSNKQQKAYVFDEKYYILFYKGENLIYHGLIYAKEAIGANAIASIEIPITEVAYTESDQFKISEIPISSYTPVSLSESEGEYKILTCVSNKDEMRYYFQDNKLAKIKETYKDSIQPIEKKGDENNQMFEKRKQLEQERYDAAIEKYYKLSDTYKQIEHFSSVFVSSTTNFAMYNEFEFKNISDTIINNLNEYKFFRYNETKDVVNFEMESMSYHCG